MNLMWIKYNARCFLLLVVVTLLCFAPAWSSEEPDGDQATDYSLDPVISGGQKAPYSPTPPISVSIEKDRDQAILQLQNESQLTPYVEAQKSKQAPADVQRLLDHDQSNPHKDIKLETGVGINLSESTNFNFGYRFDNPPSLLDKRSNENNGQFRFGLDFTLPSK